MRKKETEKLPPSFYQETTLALAPRLLGKDLVREIGDQKLVGRIVEVEAYHQDGDAAAHSFCGKTQRNAVMFGPPGCLYVYLSYGMHHCMNVVTEAEGVGAAILIRALEPRTGLSVMQTNRPKAKQARDLANGPGKACQALEIDLRHNGASLQEPQIYLTQGMGLQNEEIITSPRIGITKSVEFPWRFYLRDNAYVSRAKPGPPTNRRKTKKSR